MIGYNRKRYRYYKVIFYCMIARANRKMKEEMRKNNFKEEPTYYIDRDRAAATVAGSKDIKSELKVNCITGYHDISY